MKAPDKYFFSDLFTFKLICKVDQGAYYQRENTDSPSEVFFHQKITFRKKITFRTKKGLDQNVKTGLNYLEKT